MGSLPVPARRVLIVEDNPDNRLALHTLLELWGYAVDEAPERLGQQLQLPAFLEERRAELAAILPPLA